MFEDETVTLTSKIQDIRDIGKIFTDYSKSFTLPPSKENNKLFEHYYNESIENGFDARSKKDAILELDFLPFRKGKIFLDSVTMKNNQVFAYNITFYGNIVNLKDLLGDDELSGLPQLDTYSHDYGSSNVKTGLESGLFSGKIIYPLISHTKRFYYDSAESSPNYNGNLYYSTLNNSVGLGFEDLKPAIQCMAIIEAIENKYTTSNGYSSDIIFTRDFFNTTSGSAFSNLYLWLSRNKGPIGGDENQEEITTRICKNWGYVSGLLGFIVTDDTWAVSGRPDKRYEAEVEVQTSGANTSIPFRIKAIDYVSGNVLGQTPLVASSSTTLTIDIPSTNQNINYQIKWIVESESTLSFTPYLEITRYSVNPITGITTAVDGSTLYNINGTGDTISTTEEILITENVPKIKVVDFLSGLFKMFNLTAYYVDDANDADYEKIKVDTLDNFYADAVNNPSGGTIDITKYINISNTEIKPTTLFTEIDFKYKEPSTLLSVNHEQQFNDIFGDEEFKPVGVDRGSPYTVDVPFEHMKFERLIDENKTGTSPYSSVTSPAGYITDILWGYSADGEFTSDTTVTPNVGDYEPVLTKPLLFYSIQETGLTAGTGIKWISDTLPSEITQYYRPSNTNEDGTVSTASSFTINFDNEIDEWNLTDYDLSTNSLFKKFYQTYINDVFNQYKRTHKLKAKFPSDFLINYRLNDVLIIQDRQFTINSITTNLKDGTSDLELLIKL